MSIKNCCCTNNIKTILLTIQFLVGKINIPGFSVDLLIYTKSGEVFTVSVTQGLPNPLIINDDLLIYDKITISLCNIVKLKVLTNSVLDATFFETLKNALIEISNNCSLNIHDDNCKCGKTKKADCCCNEGIEDYLSINKSNLSTIGNYTKIDTINTINSTSSTTAVNNVTTTFESATILADINLNDNSETIVSTISTTPVVLATTILPLSNTLVSEINYTTTEVSKPITTQSTDIFPVNSVSSTTIITDINSNTIIGGSTALLFFLSYGLTDYPNKEFADGIISGITSTSIINTSTISYTPISASPGGLFINYNGTLYPLLDSLNLPVQVRNVDNLYYPPASTLVYVTGNPTTISAISNLGNKTSKYCITYMDAISPVVAISEITPISTINNIYSPSIVNTIDVIPDTVSAITNVISTFSSIQTLESIPSATISSISIINTNNAVSSMSLSTTSISALQKVNIVPAFTTVINHIGTSTINVLSPVTNQITGEINSVGCGILSIIETNNDISIYSICDIEDISI